MSAYLNDTLPLFSRDAYPSFLADPDAGQRACLGADIDLFFPERGGNATGEAKKVCARCPLKARCKAWALSRSWYELHGVWGGMSQQERKSHQLKGAIECPQCERVVKLAANGKVPRHKAEKLGRWCEWKERNEKEDAA